MYDMLYVNVGMDNGVDGWVPLPQCDDSDRRVFYIDVPKEKEEQVISYFNDKRR